MTQDVFAVPDQSQNKNQLAIKDRRLRGIWLWISRILFAGIYVGLLYFDIAEGIKNHIANSITTSDIVVDITTGCSLIIALLVFLRKSDDWFVVFSALALFIFPAGLFILQTDWSWIVIAVGICALFGFSYLFPNGQFTPKWMKIIFWVSTFSTLLFFATINWWNEESSLNEIVQIIGSIGLIAGFAGAVYSQIYGFKFASNWLERQQTKWVVVGISILFIYLILDLAVGQLESFDWFNTAFSKWLQYWDTYNNDFLIIPPLYLLFTIAVLLAIYGYGLWDVDFYLNRTLLYGAVTGFLALVWAITIALLGYLIQQFTKQSSPLVATLISSVQVAALFQPVRQRTERWINSRFYKDRVDFDEAITELQRENWQFISPKDMFSLIVAKPSRLLKSICSAIYRPEDSKFHVIETVGIDKTEAQNYLFNEAVLATLKKGDVVRVKNAEPFALLVPLVMPRQHMNDLVGILALGPRVGDEGYSRDHITDLRSLGKRAGTAIHFLQLNEQKNALR